MSPNGEKRPRQDRGLPKDFILCPRDDLIVLIARMLNTLIDLNDDYDSNNSTLSTAELTRFHSRTPPGISVHSYLARLARYSSLENAVLLSAVYYIDLLTNVYKPFTINSLTVHRFLLTVTTVGSKGLCDSFCTNTHYAKVGGIHANELDILEKEFLQRIRYRVLPRELNLQRCAFELQTELSQGRKNSLSALEQANSSTATSASAATSSSGDSAVTLPQPNSGSQASSDINVDDFKTVYTRPNSGFTLLQQLYENMIGLVGGTVNSDDSPVSYIYSLDPDYTPQADQLPSNLINTDPDTLPDQMYNTAIMRLLEQAGSIHENVPKPQISDSHIQHLHQLAHISQLDILQRRQRAEQQRQQDFIQKQQELQHTVPLSSSHPHLHQSRGSNNGSTSTQDVSRRVQLVLPEDGPEDYNGSRISLSSNGNKIQYPKSPLKRPIPDSDSTEPSGKRSLSHASD